MSRRVYGAFTVYVHWWLYWFLYWFGLFMIHTLSIRSDVEDRMHCETLEPDVKRHDLAAAISATLKTTTYQFTDVNLSHL